MIRHFKRCMLAIFLAMSVMACEPSDEQLSVNIDLLLGGFGLKSNVFEVNPQEQLGTVIFYHSQEVVERLKQHVGFEGDSRYAIQIQGKMAQEMQSKIEFFYKGTVKFDEQGVVYLFGEIADDLFTEIEKMLTVDDIHFFEGKEMIVFGGAEALSILSYTKELFGFYFERTPQKIKRTFVVSAKEGVTYTKDLLFTFIDDITVIFVNNPIEKGPIETAKNLYKLPADATSLSLEAVQKVSMLTGRIWVVTFDSVSKLCAFLSGGELIPESVLIRRTIKMVADLGYQSFYTVSDVFRSAAGIDAGGHTDRSKMHGILVNPLLTIDIASDLLKNSTHLADDFRNTSTEILVGYISDNSELLGEFLNILHENIVGDLFIFIGDTTTRAISVGSLTLKAIIRFAGNGVSALVGSLSVTQSFEAKRKSFEVVRDELVEDILSWWHELMKLLRFR